jgi:hypothetical protein
MELVSVTAQVIPVLVLVLAVELRVFQTRQRTRADVIISYFAFWGAALAEISALVMLLSERAHVLAQLGLIFEVAFLLYVIAGATLPPIPRKEPGGEPVD